MKQINPTSNKIRPSTRAVAPYQAEPHQQRHNLENSEEKLIANDPPRSNEFDAEFFGFQEREMNGAEAHFNKAPEAVVLEAQSPTKKEPKARKSFRQKSLQLILEEDTRADSNENLDFGKMSKEELEKQLHIVEINEFKCQVIISHFLEFLIYHLVYLIIGPFICFYFMCQKGGKNLAANMGFWPHLGFSFINQVIFWFMAEASLILYFTQFPKGTTKISYLEIESLVTCSVIRAVFIAAKYSIFSKQYIQVLKSRSFEFKVLTKRMLLVTWWVQGAEVIAKEIKMALRRNNVDLENFWLTFQSQVPKKRTEQMEMILQNEKNSDYEVPDQQGIYGADFKETYSAEYILKDLIFESNKKINRKRLMLFVLLYFILRSQAPGIIRSIYGESYVGSSWKDCLVFIFVAFTYINLIVLSSRFLLVMLFDLITRKRILQQLSLMISPFKNSLVASVKLYPTLDILSKTSILAWYNLRTISMNYAEGYYTRSVFSVSGFALVLSAKILYFLAIMFGFLETSSRQELATVISCIGIETGPLIIIFLLIIFYGAGINHQFSVDRKLLSDLKNIFSQFRQLEAYKCQEEEPNASNPFRKSPKSIIPDDLLAGTRSSQDHHSDSGKLGARKPEDIQMKSLKKSESPEQNQENGDIVIKSEGSEEFRKNSDDDEDVFGRNGRQVRLSQNPVIRKIQMELVVKQKLSEGEIIEKLTTLEEILENSIDALTIAEEIAPQKCCGVKLTYGLLSSSLTLLFSIGLFLVQTYFFT